MVQRGFSSDLRVQMRVRACVFVCACVVSCACVCVCVCVQGGSRDEDKIPRKSDVCTDLQTGLFIAVSKDGRDSCSRFV